MVRDFLIMEILIEVRDFQGSGLSSKPQKAAQPKPQASRLGLDTISGDCYAKFRKFDSLVSKF